MTWFQKEFAKLADRISDSLPNSTLIEKAIRYASRKLLRKMSVPAEQLAVRLSHRALMAHITMPHSCGDPEDAITAANKEDFEE